MYKTWIIAALISNLDVTDGLENQRRHHRRHGSVMPVGSPDSLELIEQDERRQQ